MTWHTLSVIDTHTLTSPTPFPAALIEAIRTSQTVELRRPDSEEDGDGIAMTLRPAYPRMAYYPAGQAHEIARRLGLLGASKTSPVEVQYRIRPRGEADAASAIEVERAGAQEVDPLLLMEPADHQIVDTLIALDVADVRRGQWIAIASCGDQKTAFRQEQDRPLRQPLQMPDIVDLRAMVAAGAIEELGEKTWAPCKQLAEQVLELATKFGQRRAWSIDAPSHFAESSWSRTSIHGRATEKVTKGGLKPQSSPRLGVGEEHGANWRWMLLGRALFLAALHDQDAAAWPLNREAWTRGLESGFVDPWELASNPRVVECFPAATARYSAHFGGTRLRQLLHDALRDSDFPARALALPYLDGGSMKTDASDAAIALLSLLPLTPFGRANAMAMHLLLDPLKTPLNSGARDVIAREGAIVVPWLSE